MTQLSIHNPVELAHRIAMLDPQESVGRIRKLYEDVGGFGTLLGITQDPEDPEWEHECLELLTTRSAYWLLI